ncbi:TPR-like protein, partial [Coniophora puteana RWD-64-598 SS2]
GLSKLYERTEQWSSYVQTLQQLMHMFSKGLNADTIKCGETYSKVIIALKEHGSRPEVIGALSLLLPSSPFYSTLSAIPPPDPSNPAASPSYAFPWPDSLELYDSLIELLEKEEESTFKSEFDKRRTRLGASPPEELKKEIGQEICESSTYLPSLYNEVLNHPQTSDGHRRETESKLIRFLERLVIALPSSTEEKARLRSELDGLVQGVVSIGIPDEYAWELYMEGNDYLQIEDIGLPQLRQFISLFHSSSLARVIRAYLVYVGLSPDEENSEGYEEEDDPYDVVLVRLASSLYSSDARRSSLDYVTASAEYTNTVKIAETALALLSKREKEAGVAMSQCRQSLEECLSWALVHLHPPRHHPRAIHLVEAALAQNAQRSRSLITKGYIMQNASRWQEAADLASRKARVIQDNTLLAEEEYSWCVSRLEGRIVEGLAGLQSVKATLEGLHEKDSSHAEDIARCVWRIGECNWANGDAEAAYASFIACLKSATNYAPAYTSLGIYYSTPKSDGAMDATRANKCFQKAFELDPREVDAARRLAEGFANEQEWDLVEVIARRTIEGEGGTTDAGGTTAGAIGRYVPMNTWAWKALGIVELTRRRYSQAVQALQVALRVDANDQLSWVRLGEAYSRAGKHVAALKALSRAQELDPADWVCTFFIGEVQREMGLFPEALASLQKILDTRPAELGALIALAQTQLDQSRQELVRGFSHRAEDTLVACIRTSLSAVQAGASAGHRAVSWKIVADALFLLAQSSPVSFIEVTQVRDILSKVTTIVGPNTHTSPRLSAIFSLSTLPDGAELAGRHALEVAIASYDYRVMLGSADEAAIGSSLYDLAIALYTWTYSLPTDNRDNVSGMAASILVQALRRNPIDATYWIAFGNINFVTKPKSSQHAYVKAIEVEGKNVVAWTNLGLLYLYHHDFELATEALYRAQVLDPDHALAWVGQALLATAKGHEEDAQNLLEYATSLTANEPSADLEFAYRTFHLFPLQPLSPSQDTIFPVYFVLDRYIKRRPSDPSALHLLGLICERMGDLERAATVLKESISLLEAAYEESEDTSIERQFTIAHTNYARVRLALQDVQGALESSQNALGLVPEVDEKNTRVLRISARIGCGLAYFRLGQLQEALDAFQSALQDIGEDVELKGHVTVLLARTMWAIEPSADFREGAKSLLLECIANDPENLLAISTLAGMGILTDDDGLVDAALSEMLSLPIEKRHELDPERNVTYLLIQHEVAQGNGERALQVAQKALHDEPSNVRVRGELALLFMQHDARQSALSLIPSGSSLEEDQKILWLAAVAEEGETTLRIAQKAVMLGPGGVENWRSLAYVRACV